MYDYGSLPRRVGPKPRDTVLEYLLGSRTRARLLVRLLDRTRREPWLREVARDVGTGASSVLREIDELERLGLVRRRREGGACFLVVDWGHPLCTPLRYLVGVAGYTSRVPAAWGRIAPDAPGERRR